MKIPKFTTFSIKQTIITSFALLFCIGTSEAQVTIFTENFNGNSHAFSLNTTDQSSTAAGYNPWLVNDVYTGGGGSLTCLGSPFSFTILNTPTQPAGIAGNPTSKYMHISSQEAVNDGVTCGSYQASDGFCFFDENSFSAMTNNISTTGYTNVNFKFWWMCGGVAASAYGEVYYSIDGGTVWLPAPGTNQYQGNVAWSQHTLTDPAFDNQTQIKFGFRFVNIATFTAGTDPGFTIDDILVEGTAATSCHTDSTFAVTACDSYTSPSGKTWMTSSTYMDTIPNAAACDSVMTISLTISTYTDSSFAMTACDSYTSPSGKTWMSSNAYMDTIPNMAGCDSVMTINLTINSADTSVTANGMMLTSNASGATYQWVDCNNGNAPIPGATSQSYNAAANGDFAVEVTENGCTGTSQCYNITGVGLTNIAFEKAISLYPNPNKGTIHLDLNADYTDLNVRISNISGQIVFEQNYNQANNLTLDLTSLASGLYFVAVNTGNKSAVMKMIKQ